MRYLIPTIACGALMLMPAVRAFSGEGAASCGACGTSKATMASLSPSTQPVEWVAYGEPTRMTDADNLNAAAVLADVEKYVGKDVRMTGEVKSVCKKKGCWLKMSSDGAPLNVFVHFTCPVDGRLIPMEAIGKSTIVEGKLKIKEISEADARHIAEEEGKTEAEVAAIVGPQKQIEVEGPSALVAK
jgi:hypothetical protein